MIRNGQYMVIDLLIHNSMGRLFVNCSFCIDPRHCSFNEFPFISWNEYESGTVIRIPTP